MNAKKRKQLRSLARAQTIGMPLRQLAVRRQQAHPYAESVVNSPDSFRGVYRGLKNPDGWRRITRYRHPVSQSVPQSVPQPTATTVIERTTLAASLWSQLRAWYRRFVRA